MTYLLRFIILVLHLNFIIESIDTTSKLEKLQFCSTLKCENRSQNVVCGIREDGEGFRLRFFESECALLKYGCTVPDKLTYGVINKEYCAQSLSNTDDKDNIHVLDSCEDFDCDINQAQKVCGIRPDGAGFRIKLFINECHLLKYNCEEKLNFTVTDLYICNELTVSDYNTIIKRKTLHKTTKIIKTGNIVVVDGALINDNGNVNETVENFFAATHYLNMPLVELNNVSLNENTRRNILLKNAGPIKVFEPWIKVPQNLTTYINNTDYEPTISSCYHKCPKSCPDLYAPVCGVPGIAAREPSLMFKNHCYMDVAQCKMKRENKSSTSDSSDYIESSFVFCLGDTMNVMYRFLPLVRTLQHMGRLRKKGYFRYKLRNMKFLNNYLMRQPKFMG